MIQWKDDNSNLDNFFYNFYAGNPVTPICCNNPDVHTYFHKFSISSERGSGWVWCSNCKNFSHLDGVRINKNIPNCSEVDPIKLCAVPEYLENIKSIIDSHNNSIKD